jgi:hypothetical protein
MSKRFNRFNMRGGIYPENDTEFEEFKKKDHNV